jgi:hypothetical protein
VKLAVCPAVTVWFTGCVLIPGTTGAGFTVSVTVVVAVKVPEVPMIVTVAIPVAAVLLAVVVNVLVLAVLAGLNDAVTPAGKPVATRLTFPLKPFAGVTLIVELAPVAFCVVVTLAGDADSAKLGVGGGSGVPTDTLSKVALTREDAFPLVTAKPTYTGVPIVIVLLVAICVHVTPSGDA